jgi:hypothetical protein
MALFHIEKEVVSPRIAVAGLSHAAGIDEVLPSRCCHEIVFRFKHPDRISGELGKNHWTMGMAEESEANPRITIRQVIKHELSCVRCAEVTGRAARKPVEQEYPRKGRKVQGKIAKGLPDAGGQDIVGPSNGLGSCGVEPLGLGEITGCLFVVPGEENGIQVGEKLETCERVSSVPHRVTEVPEVFGALGPHVLDHSLECGEVRMDIGKNGNSHENYLTTHDGMDTGENRKKGKNIHQYSQNEEEIRVLHP